MIVTFVRIIGLALLLLWLPLMVAWIPMALYAFFYGRVVPVVLVMLIDWYLLASVPYLTLCALAIVVLVPLVRTRTMLYTT
jgi:hypothetical protein